MTSRTSLAAAAFLALTLGGVIAALRSAPQSDEQTTDTATPTSTTPPSPEPKARSCPQTIPRVDLQCGFLRVDDQDSKRTSELAYTIVRGRNTPRARFMIYVDGGPGEATSSNLEDQIESLRPLLAQTAMVFLDQRGTGASRPRLDCPGFGSTSSHAKECHQYLNERYDLSALGRETTVRDLVTLRQALGIRRWDILGVSDGVWTAIRLANADRPATRTLLLDSAAQNQGGQDWAARVYRRLGEHLGALEGLERSLERIRRELGDAQARNAVRRLVNATQSHHYEKHLKEAITAISDGRIPPIHPVARDLALGVHLQIICSEREASPAPVVRDNVPKIWRELLVPEQYETSCNQWPTTSLSRTANDTKIPGDLPTLVLVGEADPLAEQLADAHPILQSGTWVTFDGLSHIVTTTTCGSTVAANWLLNEGQQAPQPKVDCHSERGD